MSKGLVFGAGFLLLVGVGGTLAFRNGWLGSTPSADAAAPGGKSGSSSTSTASQPPTTRAAKPVDLPPVFTKLSAEERAELKLFQQIKGLRAQIETWKQRHEGRSPDFECNPMWQQFLVREGKHGPYVKAAPVNVANNFFRVLSMRGPVKPGEEVSVAGIGWVYCVKASKLWATDSHGKVFDDGALDVGALEARATLDLPPREQEAKLLSGLLTLRTQLKRYDKEHKNRPPDFGKHPAFEQLLKVTTPDGRIVAIPPGPSVCGPYLPTLPINPLNGMYKVVVVTGEVRPGQKVSAKANAGFVYSASNWNIYATDRNGRVFDDVSASKVQADLAAEMVKELRDKIDRYKLQHEEKAPDLKRFPRWEQLTGKTRADGTPDPKGTFGPYLDKPPVNPRNGSSAAEVVERLPKVAGFKPPKKVGWVYESTSGMVWATDETGKIVAD
jgi:hypothetical protein